MQAITSFPKEEDAFNDSYAFINTYLYYPKKSFISSIFS